MMEELLVIEPIIAYRYWRIANYTDGYKLTGIVLGYTWEKGVNLAKCIKNQSPVYYSREEACENAPSFWCQCGFYAYKTVDLARTMLGNAIRFQYSGRRYAFMFGEVELTGKVIEHQYGYRGEKARIEKLAPGPFSRACTPRYGYYITEKVSQYYEVPLMEGM